MKDRFTIACACAAALTWTDVLAQEVALSPMAANPPSTAAVQTITRAITLAELGYVDGLTFQRLDGTATLYFPVPQTTQLEGGTLVLDLDSGATSAATRYLQVTISERIVWSQSLDAERVSRRIAVPFTAADRRNGFIEVGLTYSGALSDQVCIDTRASGDYVTIGSGSGVTLELDPQALMAPGRMAAIMPRDVRLVFNDDSPANLAVALTAASLFDAETGRLHVTTQPDANANRTAWAISDILVSTTEFGGASEMIVSQQDGFPALSISGSNPQIGLQQLSSIWAGLSYQGPSYTKQIGTTAPHDEAVLLADLVGNLPPQQVVTSSTFELPFSADDIPRGRQIDSLALIAASALDPDGQGATLTAFLNDTMLGSRPLDSGQPAQMSFDIPHDLVGRANTLRVVVQRQPAGGSCTDKTQAYPAQILPGSRFLLAADDSAADDFFRLSRQFGAGAELVVAPDITLSQDELLRWTAGVAGAILPDGTPVVLRRDIAALAGPGAFIIVSNAAPAGTNAAVTLDEGAISIRDADGTVLFEGQDLDRLGIVQIVSLDGKKGLWIRPGSGPAPELSQAQPLVLDRGDLALLDDSGVVVVTSTMRSDVLSIVYPERTSITQILAKYRPWLMGGLWLLLTLMMLSVFQRLYRSRRDAAAPD